MKVVLNTNHISNRRLSNTQSFGSTNNAVAQGITEIRNTSVFNKRNGILAAITAGIIAFGYYIFKPQEEKTIHPSRYKV